MPRLLIIKTSSLGDVVHTLPVVTDLCRMCPDWEVDWLVEEALAEIPRLHPGVAQTIPCAFRRWRKNPWCKDYREEWRDLKQLLQKNAYDLVLDLQGLWKSVILSRMAPGMKVGYSWDSAREPWASLFYHKRYSVARQQHAIVRNRMLSALALDYELGINTPPDYGLADMLQETGNTLIPLLRELIPGAPPKKGGYLLFFHGASHTKKYWPVASWRGLLAKLRTSGRPVLLPWGSTKEKMQAEYIADGFPSAKVLPKQLTLTQLANLAAWSRAVVGVDSGLTHLGASVGVPVIALYTATSPARTGVVADRGIAPVCNIGGPTQEEFFQGGAPPVEVVWQVMEGLKIVHAPILAGFR